MYSLSSEPRQYVPRHRRWPAALACNLPSRAFVSLCELPASTTKEVRFSIVKSAGAAGELIAVHTVTIRVDVLDTLVDLDAVPYRGVLSTETRNPSSQGTVCTVVASSEFGHEMLSSSSAPTSNTTRLRVVKLPRCEAMYGNSPAWPISATRHGTVMFLLTSEG